MQPVEALLDAPLRDAIGRVLGRAWDGPVPLEVSNRPELGDYASPVAFAVARAAGRPPFEVAEALAAALAAEGGPLVARAVAAAPAFLNLRLADAYLGAVVAAAHAAGGAIADAGSGDGSKVVVEHTNINPNKAAHVGHLRNACLGDSLARILRRVGHEVEVQNYIDDTGVQVADLVVGLRHLDRLDLPPRPPAEPFDRFCSEVYVAVQAAYAEDLTLVAERAAVQGALESGEGPIAAQAREVAQRVAAANLGTMARVGIGYDLLTWESDILALGFWRHAFERLRASGAVVHEEAGPNAGCWVLPFGLGTVETGGGTVTEDKVLVTSRGIATYTAKDIAYQLWKFGLLGLDFGYVRWGHAPDGRETWTTTRAGGAPDAPAFARADRVINVIDAKQSYLQQVVYDSLRRLGYDQAAERSEHLAYGVVTLTADAARQLGVEVDADASTVAMSGRQGVQVLADDLFDRLAALVAERAASPEAAAAVAAGAARYYLLKFSNNQPIAFDFEEALRTTGETGVYLVYAYVRAGGIVRKLEAAETRPSEPPADPPGLDRALVLKMAQYPRLLAASADLRSVQVVAKYAFELATAFNAFYDNTPPVVSEPDPALRAWRGGLVAAFRLVMADVLDVLGIPALERL